MTPMDQEVTRELDHLDRRLMAVEHVPLRIAAMEVEMSGLREDVNELKELFSARVRERAHERDRSREERKSDRRWLIGTTATAAGLVIAAMAILLPALS